LSATIVAAIVARAMQGASSGSGPLSPMLRARSSLLEGFDRACLAAAFKTHAPWDPEDAADGARRDSGALTLPPAALEPACKAEAAGPPTWQEAGAEARRWGAARGGFCFKQVPFMDEACCAIQGVCP
jgi:hypothetical protein